MQFLIEWVIYVLCNREIHANVILQNINPYLMKYAIKNTVGMCWTRSIFCSSTARQGRRKAVQNGSIPESTNCGAIRGNDKAPLPSRPWKNIPRKFQV